MNSFPEADNIKVNSFPEADNIVRYIDRTQGAALQNRYNLVHTVYYRGGPHLRRQETAERHSNFLFPAAGGSAEAPNFLNFAPALRAGPIKLLKPNRSQRRQERSLRQPRASQRSYVT